MQTKIGRFVFLVLVLSVVPAWSQTDTTGQTPDNQTTTPGPKPAYTYPDSASPMSFLSDTAENSSLTLGVNGGIVYDTNVSQFNNGANESAILYQVRPSIKLQQYRSKLSWTFEYQGGLQSRSYLGNNPAFNSVQSNIFSQNASADILWQLSPRWQLHVNDSYVYTADPFESYITYAGIPTGNNPNPTAYGPLSTFNGNLGSVSLTNQLAAHDTLTFTGTEDFRRVSNYGTTLSTPFQNMVSYGGRADYNHQLSARLSLGAGYEFDSLDFGHGEQRSGVQTIRFSTSYMIKPNMTISVWVGPEYTGVKNVIQIFFFTEIVHESQWNTSGGANFGWQGVHNTFRASFNHQVSNGSVLLGTTSVYQGTVDYSRILNPRWTLTAGVQYFNNESISLSRRTFEESIGTATLTCKLSPSLNANVQYGFLHETQQNIYVGKPTYVASQFGVNIQYNWNHPLGR